ncbi:antibiotic biosynthesis monooxygenase [Bradyrhizobium sp. USDA 4471]
MYAAIRQAKAKSGSAEELARRIKDGAVPIISDVDGFRAYYVVYAGDDTVTAISIFDKFEQAEEREQARHRLDREGPGLAARRACERCGGAGDRAYAGVSPRRCEERSDEAIQLAETAWIASLRSQ